MASTTTLCRRSDQASPGSMMHRSSGAASAIGVLMVSAKTGSEHPPQEFLHGMHSAVCLLSGHCLWAVPCMLSVHWPSIRLFLSLDLHIDTLTRPPALAAGMKSQLAPKPPAAQPKPVQQQPQQEPQQPRSPISPSKQPVAADAAPSEPQQQQQAVSSAGGAADRAASEQQQYQHHLQAASTANAALRDNTAASSKQTQASVQGQRPARLQLPGLHCSLLLRRQCSFCVCLGEQLLANTTGLILFSSAASA